MKVSAYITAVALFATLVLTGCPETSSGTTPKTDPAPVASPSAPVKPLVTAPKVADWCPEHGVPESVCTRCNDGLVAGFKAKGDWCKTHDLPDSQCLKCHPEFEAKFKAMAPK
jgi:hypothetical protein